MNELRILQPLGPFKFSLLLAAALECRTQLKLCSYDKLIIEFNSMCNGINILNVLFYCDSRVTIIFSWIGDLLELSLIHI